MLSFPTVVIYYTLYIMFAGGPAKETIYERT